MSLFGELRRRNVFRVGIAYLAVVWLLLQVADLVVPILDAPPWLLRALFFSSVLGFPLALVLAWFYELTPEGIRVASEVEAIEGVRFTGRKLDFAIIGVLVLAVGFLLVRPQLEDQATVLPNSVAVLPFENLSPDPNDAYFAAGIHEEVLNQLAKLRNLNVISRTSVVRYADSDLSIPEIANELNVETVMEGSVRYADDRVLVTAQLVDPESDVHLWSESYNRDFSDIFAIQADIAMNIANALEAEFSISEQQSIEKIPTQSAAAYAFYLRALTATDDEFLSAINQAIALDPEFALAYARRASANTVRLAGALTGLAPDEALDLERRVYEDAETALSIDPTLGLAHAVLAAVHQANWRGTAAEQAFQRALEMSPNDAAGLMVYGRFKRYRGEYEEAVRLTRRAIELDPNSPLFHSQLGFVYRYAGDWDAAAAAYQNAQNLNPSLGRYLQLGYVEASRGNAAEAERLLQLAEQWERPPVFRLAQMAHAYALVGRPDEATRLFADFEERATEEGVGEGWWAHAYIAVGDYGQALQRIESAVNERVTADQAALTILAANPWSDPQLESPEFRALLDGLWDDE